jgi:hypothetical protein
MLGCKVVPSLDRCRQIFEANIETGKLSDIGLVLFENSAMDVTRPADHLARSENDELFFCRLMSGTLSLEQDGRQVILEAGDLVLRDPLLPYSVNVSRGSKLLVLKIPRRAAEARVGHTRQMVPIGVSPSEPKHRWTFFFGMSPGVADAIPHAVEAIAQEQTLTNPALNRADVAEAAGISVRLAEQNDYRHSPHGSGRLSRGSGRDQRSLAPGLCFRIEPGRRVSALRPPVQTLCP